jgi:hypothetical protein
LDNKDNLIGGIFILIGVVIFFVWSFLQFFGEIVNKKRNGEGVSFENLFLVIFLGLLLIGVFNDGCN